jgi:hypothetical protein
VSSSNGRARRRLMAGAAFAAVAASALVTPIHAAPAAAAGFVASSAATPKEGDVRGHRRILVVGYTTVADCVISPNYQRASGAWTIPAGQTINWRYNVTSRVAAVSDPAGHAKGFPWWGFTQDSSCIGVSVGQRGHYDVFHDGRWVRHDVSFPAGRPMPRRILSGRSQFEPYWRAVDWRIGHGDIPSHLVRMTHNATLRDRPNRFVIGNVLDGWRVRAGSAHPSGWTRVYVPVLRRWGWVIV